VKVSEFQFMRVETEGGRFLGHVFDLRSHGEPEHGETHDARVVNEIVYGRLGLLERLGIVQAEPDTIPWEAVKEVRGNKIIVDDAVALQK
jgi:sporulation protein YlmC with PRC-barrel domain